jgi:hypothetical protein
MHITNGLIDPELRWIGKLMRLLLKPATPGAFRKLNRLGTHPPLLTGILFWA